MKTVCFFICNLNNSGGTERVTSVIANELQERGYHVHILSLDFITKPFFKLDHKIRVSSLSDKNIRGAFKFPLVVSRLRKFIIKNKIEVIINVESMLALYTSPAIVGINLKHICWEHFNYNVDLGRYGRRLARKLAARISDNVITLTERDRDLWRQNTICNAKIVSIPNPMTINRPEFINFHKNKILLSVGRLTHQKGFDLLLQAWSKIAQTHQDWKLRIIGSGDDERTLKKMCVDLHIDGQTEFIKNTTDIAKHYQECSFFIMSSRFEGLPLVLIEAQSYGLPIVSFDCDTGPSEIVIDGKTGWLCTPNDISALAITIDTAIVFSKNTNAFLKAQQFSVENSKRFSRELIMDSWIKLLSD